MTLRTAMLADLDLYIADWGEACTIVETSVTGVFDAPFAAVSPLTGQVESAEPTLTIRSADFPASADHGSAVTIGSKSYTIAGIQPDGHGLTVLILRESA